MDERGLWKRSVSLSLSLYGSPARGTWRKCSFLGTLRDIQRKALEMNISVPMDPVG
jgi:hypothetical protein